MKGFKQQYNFVPYIMMQCLFHIYKKKMNNFLIKILIELSENQNNSTLFLNPRIAYYRSSEN